MTFGALGAVSRKAWRLEGTKPLPAYAKEAVEKHISLDMSIFMSRPMMWEIAEHKDASVGMLQDLLPYATQITDVPLQESHARALAKRIANHPNATNQILRQLSVGASGACTSIIVQHPNVESNTLEYIVHNSTTVSPLLAVARHTESPNLLSILAGHDNYQVQRAVANNSAISCETAENFAQDASSVIAREVADNARLSPATLDRLAKQGDFFVRQEVARNPSTAPDTLRHLGDDTDYQVRRNVAFNPNTPDVVLHLLALATDADDLPYGRLSELALATLARKKKAREAAEKDAIAG